MEPELNQPATPQGFTRYKWWVVFMLWFVCFQLRGQAISVLPVLEQELADKQQQGYISSAFMWCMPRLRSLVALSAIGVAANDWLPLLEFHHHHDRLVLETLALSPFEQSGFGETFYFPASMSLVSDYHSPDPPLGRCRSSISVYVGTIM
jgi:hypothetical protein